MWQVLKKRGNSRIYNIVINDLYDKIATNSRVIERVTKGFANFINVICYSISR